MASMTAAAGPSPAMGSASPAGITLTGYDPALPYDLPLPYAGGALGASMGAG